MKRLGTTRTPLIRHRHPRGGYLYLSVMGVALIVSVVGFVSLTLARIHLKNAQTGTEAGEAGLLALSAIENAVVVLNGDPNWRTNFVNDVEYPATPPTLGNGTFTWKLVDADGNLADDVADMTQLYGIGTVNGVVHAESVWLQPTGGALTCLEVAAHAGADFFYKSSTTTSDQILSANAEHRTQVNATINADVEAVLTISGSGYNGTQTTGITPRTMPDPNTVFDYYVANGTAISISDLAGGSPRVLNQLFSPASNPFGSGATNAEGIYVIDCLGQKINIEDCRIVGTLVLLNVGAESYVKDTLNWEPAVANYPALLCQASSIYFYSGTGTLDESSVGNMNPPGTPYQGVTDSDLADSYPAIIKGLVYVTGEIKLDSEGNFEGVMVAGADINPFSDTILNYNPIFLNNPPPGFTSGNGVKIYGGSWARAASP